MSFVWALLLACHSAPSTDAPPTKPSEASAKVHVELPDGMSATLGGAAVPGTGEAEVTVGRTSLIVAMPDGRTVQCSFMIKDASRIRFEPVAGGAGGKVTIDDKPAPSCFVSKRATN